MLSFMDSLRLMVMILALINSSVVVVARERWMLIAETNEHAGLFTSALDASDDVDVEVVMMDHDNEDTQLQEIESRLSSTSISMVVDMSWGGFETLSSSLSSSSSSSSSVLYIRVEASQHPLLRAGDIFLDHIHALDSATILESLEHAEAAFYFLLNGSRIKTLLMTQDELHRLDLLRPAANHHLVLGNADALRAVAKDPKAKEYMRHDNQWTFLATDLSDVDDVDLVKNLNIDVYLGIMKPDTACCALTGKNASGCDCERSSRPHSLFLPRASRLLVEMVAGMRSENIDFTSNASKDATMDFLASRAEESGFVFKQEEQLLVYRTDVDFYSLSGSVRSLSGTYSSSSQSFTPSPNFVPSPPPRFFRVGMVEMKPWAWRDSENKLVGYCVEMVAEMAKRMNFDYDIIVPDDNVIGERTKNESGEFWDGVTGLLVDGVVDMAVTSMTMTTAREEVIDFVSPYFEQSGIAILLRKPHKPRSLFKFMDVLRAEVWVTILSTLVITAIMLWFLDRFSPYSARNNREAYPYPTREFTLKESFWFAVTSFTPQGGGEAPKSLSGRVLVSAYWLFVVLMLATFTANLAAFLTVERMRTTIQSLEELAQQTKIKYTVVAGSPHLRFFQNMAKAEEELYQAWNDLTLSKSSGSGNDYLVWDYPIREQYTHLLNTIIDTGLVVDAEEGVRKVLDDLDGNFAFIHDASRVKYEAYSNCNLSVVGDAFAEQPYAVAVRQGFTALKDEMSKAILLMQGDRFFERISSRYWNTSLECPTLDDSDGITLTSLGGVFIATVSGLVISIVLLVYEMVVVSNREKNNQVKPSSMSGKEKDLANIPSTGKESVRVVQVGSKKLTLSNVN